jgi:hypothetical protein
LAISGKTGSDMGNLNFVKLMQKAFLSSFGYIRKMVVFQDYLSTVAFKPDSASLFEHRICLYHPHLPIKNE